RIGSTSASQKVTVKNTGTQSLSVTSSASGGPTFGITPAPGTINLGPGATRDYLVSCTPQVPTELAGSLTFSAGNLVASASYSCNGVASFLDIVPSPAAFDDALVGAPPPNVTVTITNVNEVETEISDIALDPAAIAAGVAIATLPQIPITLQPNDFIAVPLSYTAASQHTGTLGGLIVTESGSPSRTVPISGEALLGEIGTSPSSVEFGPICGDTTATRDVMVYAAAAGDIDLESITKPESPFDTTTPTGTLTGNHGPGITLTTSVSSSTAGEVTGSLVLNSNAPADRMHEVPMTALVLPPGVSPTPEAVQFGGAMVGGLTTGKQVTITNCTAAAVDITDVRIEGPDATEFSIVSPETVQASIDQRGGQTYLLVLSPRSVGLKSAQLVVEYAGERKIVDLDGNGFADPSDATERTTYYDCSTTGGAGAWPIALALLGVTRRRRNRQVSRSDRATE
ncbi:MAG: choice-of-anchor D domain-containing protein, partial [Kofleriaceae bacterium]